MTSSRSPLFTAALVGAVVFTLLVLFSYPGLADEKKEGQARIYVFNEDGRPLEGVECVISGVKKITGPSGVAAFDLPEGEYNLVFMEDGKEKSKTAVIVVAGGVTEIIVTFGKKLKKPEYMVETPAKRGSLAADADLSEKEKGFITGTVVSEKDNSPIVGAHVFVSMVRDKTVTDKDGRFKIEVPAGDRMVSIIHTEYANERLEVTVPGNDTVDVRAVMQPSSVELAAIQISGKRILGEATLQDIRKEEDAQVNIIGPQAMAKSGASDAASALKRVTGLTVVGGRYVYIRGMGERYSCSLLDGSTLPSPEPERRVVPLDIFPTSVIESITIQKTYSPDMPADFGGGAVKIKTLGMPEKPFVSASLSFGYLSTTTGLEGLEHKGGSKDFWGYDDGTRDYPKIIKIATARGTINDSEFTDAELEEFGEAMIGPWSPKSTTIPYDKGFGVSFGSKWDIDNDSNLGFLFGGMFSNSYDTVDSVFRDFSSSFNRMVDYDIDTTTNSVKVGNLLTLASDINKKRNHLASTTLLVRTTKNVSERYEGWYEANNSDIKVQEIQWLEQTLFSNSFRGKHRMNADKFVLDWNVTLSKATRYEPNRRVTMYEWEESDATWYLSNRPEGNQIVYNDLSDHNRDYKLNGKYNFKIREKQKGYFKTGFNYITRRRHSTVRRFKYFHRGPDSYDSDILRLPPEQIFIEEYIGANGFEFEEHSVGTDDYGAEQVVEAGYVMGQIPLSKLVVMNAGIRIEKSDQTVTTFSLHDPSADPIDASLVTNDWLPALNFTWDFAKNMKLRAGFSRTINRPDFRELSEAPYEQVVGGRMVIGNKDLQRAIIKSYDLRWEYFFSKDEMLSSTVFFKEMTDPIETFIIGGSNSYVTYENAKGADNFGIEFEFRKKLGIIHRSLKDFFTEGNIAFIDSEVDLGAKVGIATEVKRPLCGQSPYVFNWSFGYDNPDVGLVVTLLYNVFGKRIDSVGTYDLPDVYEESRQQLDFVLSWKFLDHWKVGFKIKNILEEDQVFKQGSEIKESHEKGMAVSFGVTAKF